MCFHCLEKKSSKSKDNLKNVILFLRLSLDPLEECPRGFSNSGILTIGALFMVAAGMYTTGAIGMVSEKLIGLPKTLLGCQLKMLPQVALGSAFLNDTPIVAMMIPIIRDLLRTAILPAKRLYIPLSFASILGGACTLIGTATNLMLAGMVSDQIAQSDPAVAAMRAIQMFDTAWVAVPATILGLAFMRLCSKWLLPSEKSEEEHAYHQKQMVFASAR